jgi:hypothetical protein
MRCICCRCVRFFLFLCMTTKEKLWSFDDRKSSSSQSSPSISDLRPNRPTGIWIGDISQVFRDRDDVNDEYDACFIAYGAIISLPGSITKMILCVPISNRESVRIFAGRPSVSHWFSVVLFDQSELVSALVPYLHGISCACWARYKLLSPFEIRLNHLLIVPLHACTKTINGMWLIFV